MFRARAFVGCAQEQPLRSLIEEAWRHAAKTLGTAPWKLDEPIWTVGSKLCSERKCGQCPVEDLCGKTKGITFKENTVVWKPRARGSRIAIGTDEMPAREGENRARMVSRIEITLAKE